MVPELSRSISRETSRARPLRGGKTGCSWVGCSEDHAPGSGYCRTHKAEYMRGWRKSQAEERAAKDEELKRLRAVHGDAGA
jgi:hypothetical protein